MIGRPDHSPGVDVKDLTAAVIIIAAVLLITVLIIGVLPLISKSPSINT
jgi:hypothetical protein